MSEAESKVYSPRRSISMGSKQSYESVNVQSVSKKGRRKRRKSRF